MRKILILSAGLLTLCATSALGDVLLYKLTESSRLIGYDKNRSSLASGFIALDWDTGEVRILRASIANGSRQFTISNPGGIRVYVAQGPANSTYTVMSRYQEKYAPYTEILDVMYGVDHVLAIRPDRLVYSPKVFKGSPREVIVPGSDDDVILALRTVTANYLAKDTQAANAANQSVDGVMERYRALYLAKGYYEVADTQ